MRAISTLKETAERVCAFNQTSLAGIVDDLQSMRMIGCGGAHERKINGDAARYCHNRGKNMSCLHPKTSAEGSRLVVDSVMVRLQGYLRILAEIYTSSNSEMLRTALHFDHPNQPTQTIAEESPLGVTMKLIDNDGYRVDLNAGHFHQQLPILDACQAIEPEQTAIGQRVKRCRDRILAVFLRIQLR